MYSFTVNETERIQGRFGNVFWEQLEDKLAWCASCWSLSGLQLLPSFSANCVFTCESAIFGKAILKLGPPSKEWETETSALLEYNGERYCQLFAADADHCAILEERILPGICLREEESLAKRLSVFSRLAAGLHVKPFNADVYPSYFDWVSRISRYMRGRGDYPELCEHMQKAEALCRSLWAAYPRRLLLHGDLHHDNILMEEGGGYRIIDPKGVVGDPVFEIPRFILNEFDEVINSGTYGRINTIIITLAVQLDIPETVIRECLYIETAMAECWNVESRQSPSMDHVALAEALLPKIPA